MKRASFGKEIEDKKESIERLQKEIGHVFPHGITEVIYVFCSAFDAYNIPQEKITEMCIKAGISYTGHKKLVAARLLANEFDLLGNKQN